MLSIARSIHRSFQSPYESTNSPCLANPRIGQQRFLASDALHFAYPGVLLKPAQHGIGDLAVHLDVAFAGKGEGIRGGSREVVERWELWELWEL